MATAKETALKLSADFDRLTTNHRRMTKTLLDALAPGVKQKDRDALRQAFAPYVAGEAAETQPAVGSGSPPLE